MILSRINNPKVGVDAEQEKTPDKQLWEYRETVAFSVCISDFLKIPVDDICIVIVM
jgi:hypothetical protein